MKAAEERAENAPHLVQRILEGGRAASAVLPAVGEENDDLAGQRRLRKVFDLYVDLNLPFADAYHVALMQRLGLRHIVSFDKEFNRVPGVTRVEPGEDG